MGRASIGPDPAIKGHSIDQHPLNYSVVMLATVAVMVFTHDLAQGVLVGVLLSGFFFAHKVGQVLYISSRSVDEGRVRHYHVLGQVFFASADRFIAAFDYKEVIVEQETGVRLFVLGRRGESAESTQRDLGRNVERVVRGLHKPILTVTDEFSEPRRVLIAFDGGSVTRKGVIMVASSPLFKGLPVHVLMSGKAHQDAPKQLEWGKTMLESAGFEVLPALIPGDAESVIAGYVKQHEIDILIIGSYSHSPLRSLLFGSKTSDLLRSAKIPTLLLR